MMSWNYIIVVRNGYCDKEVWISKNLYVSVFKFGHIIPMYPDPVAFSKVLKILDDNFQMFLKMQIGVQI